MYSFRESNCNIFKCIPIIDRVTYFGKFMPSREARKKLGKLFSRCDFGEEKHESVPKNFNRYNYEITM